MKHPYRSLLVLIFCAVFCLQALAGKLVYPEQGFYVDLPDDYEWFEIESPKIDPESTPLYVTEKQKRIFLMISHSHIPGGGSVKDSDIKEGFESELPDFKISYSPFLKMDSALYEFSSLTNGVIIHNRTRLVLFGEDAFVFSLMSSDRDYLDSWSLEGLIRKGSIKTE